MAAGAVQFQFSPLFGALSVRIGPPRVMVRGALLVGIGMYPAFVFIGAGPTVSKIVFAQVIPGFGLSAYFAPVPALMGRLFGTQARTTGLSVSYSIAVTIFGGFAPFIVTWLIGMTGDNLSPVYYVAFGALVSLVFLASCVRSTRISPADRLIPPP